MQIAEQDLFGKQGTIIPLAYTLICLPQSEHKLIAQLKSPALSNAEVMNKSKIVLLGTSFSRLEKFGGSVPIHLLGLAVQVD